MNIGLYVTLPLAIDDDFPRYIIDARGKTVFCRDVDKIASWARLLLNSEDLSFLQNEVDKILEQNCLQLGSDG